MDNLGDHGDYGECVDDRGAAHTGRAELDQATGCSCSGTNGCDRNASQPRTTTTDIYSTGDGYTGFAGADQYTHTDQYPDRGDGHPDRGNGHPHRGDGHPDQYITPNTYPFANTGYDPCKQICFIEHCQYRAIIQLQSGGYNAE